MDQVHWAGGDLRTMARLTVGWKDFRLFNVASDVSPVHTVMPRRFIEYQSCSRDEH